MYRTYMYFKHVMSLEMQANNPYIQHRELNRELSIMWTNLSDEERRMWADAADSVDGMC